MSIFIIILTNIIWAVTLSGQSVPDTVKGDIALRTYVESEEIPLNREVIYHVELRWKGDLNRYQINKLGEPILTNLILRGSGSSNRDAGSMAIKQFTFYLRPLEMGMAYIDGAKITYTDINNTEGSLLSSRIGVKIVEPLPDAGDNSLSTVIIFTLMGIFIIAALFLFIYRYQTRKKAEQEKKSQEISETIEEKYRRLLNETIHVKSENLKDSMADLSHLMMGYLSERFNLPSGNLTTKDLISLLRDWEFGADNLEKLEDFLTKADLVKFAGEPVTESEFHRYYDAVEIMLRNQNI